MFGISPQTGDQARPRRGRPPAAPAVIVAVGAEKVVAPAAAAAESSVRGDPPGAHHGALTCTVRYDT